MSSNPQMISGLWSGQSYPYQIPANYMPNFIRLSTCDFGGLLKNCRCHENCAVDRSVWRKKGIMSLGNKNLKDCQFLDINYNGYAFLWQETFGCRYPQIWQTIRLLKIPAVNFLILRRFDGLAANPFNIEIGPTCLKFFLVISRIAVNMYHNQSGNTLTRVRRYWKLKIVRLRWK